ncbi:hypothetical protein [Synechococcus sp. CBW1006]|uniref:hypothetical protein n=1 Tax=Synechococcus sp. CBW1006 TaxID=1353138 RepID=UPI0018CEDFE9|nr:hypothetical protein [Synechococcus sp. CBW1006]QPN65939.1 hypothetical protein H8F26_13895 [Synechococcus sp. CBW1006]
MGFDQLDFWEAAFVFGLIALIGWETWQAFSSRSWVSAYRPTLFVAVILSYYCLLGPLRALAGEEGAVFRGLDHSGVLLWGWAGGFVFYVCLLIGFYTFSQKCTPHRLILKVNPDQLHRLGLRLCQLGLLMFSLVTGTRVLALINPLAAYQLTQQGGFGQEGLDVGAFVNYFNSGINFLIPGICLMMAAWLRWRKRTASLLLWIVATAGIYTSLGFRWRLVLLLVPLILLWFMARQQRPSLGLLAFFTAGLITLGGLIGISRNYGRGLDLGALEDTATVDYFEQGFTEATTFFTTAGVMEQAPVRSPFIGPAPLMATILFPIPRALFPGKPDASYITDATAQLYGGANLAMGSAFLNYAEYYLIAGWPSLVGLSLLLGWLLRRLWNWFLLRQDEPFAQCVYLISSSFLYVVISRGYLPQVILLFVFTVAPLFWLYRRIARPVDTSHVRPAPPVSSHIP